MEVKEIQMSPLDKDLKVFICRYKNWNGGRASAPVNVLKNRNPQVDGYTLPNVRFYPDTPYEYTVNKDGVVEFETALLATDVVHAGFTFRLFSEDELNVALKTVGFSTLASMLPVSIDDQCIADFLVEPLILATMIHLRESMLTEQSLYYSYSIQEQSHQLKQVHDSLESDINRDRAALDGLIDSDLWFRFQGHAKRTTSVLRGDRSAFGTPWIVGGARGDGR